MTALACILTLLVALGTSWAHAADIGYLASPGVAAREFPSPRRPVAPIVSPSRSSEEHRDSLIEHAAVREGSALDVSKKLARLDQRRFDPPPGTVLVREWDRKSHRVMVMQDSYAWNGRTFDSLSQVALAITGTKWNGPRFFGLRDRHPQINAGEPE